MLKQIMPAGTKTCFSDVKESKWVEAEGNVEARVSRLRREADFCTMADWCLSCNLHPVDNAPSMKKYKQ